MCIKGSDQITFALGEFKSYNDFQGPLRKFKNTCTLEYNLVFFYLLIFTVFEKRRHAIQVAPPILLL